MILKITSNAVCALLACGGAALACPVASSLDGSGIEITDEEGTTITHTRAGEGITVVVDYGDDTGAVETRAAGLYPQRVDFTENGEVLDGEAAVMAYEDALPTPSPGMTFETQSTMQTGTKVTDWTLTYEMGGANTQAIGDCSYEVIEIDLSMQGPLAPPQRERYLYFTDLGIAHLAWSGVGNMSIPTGPTAIRVAGENQ